MGDKVIPRMAGMDFFFLAFWRWFCSRLCRRTRAAMGPACSAFNQDTRCTSSSLFMHHWTWVRSVLCAGGDLGLP